MKQDYWMRNDEDGELYIVKAHSLKHAKRQIANALKISRRKLKLAKEVMPA